MTKETSVFKLPHLNDLAAVAGLPVAFGTAHLALRERANLQAGQTVLVLGAAGGVGAAAVQVCYISCQAIKAPSECPISGFGLRPAYISDDKRAAALQYENSSEKGSFLCH